MADGLGSGAAILFTRMWKQSASISSLMAIGSGFALLMAVIFVLTLSRSASTRPLHPARWRP